MQSASLPGCVVSALRVSASAPSAATHIECMLRTTYSTIRESRLHGIWPALISCSTHMTPFAADDFQRTGLSQTSAILRKVFWTTTTRPLHPHPPSRRYRAYNKLEHKLHPSPQLALQSPSLWLCYYATSHHSHRSDLAFPAPDASIFPLVSTIAVPYP